MFFVPHVHRGDASLRFNPYCRASKKPVLIPSTVVLYARDATSAAQGNNEKRRGQLASEPVSSLKPHPTWITLL